MENKADSNKYIKNSQLYAMIENKKVVIQSAVRKQMFECYS